jgi:hypothetical protein
MESGRTHPRFNGCRSGDQIRVVVIGSDLFMCFCNIELAGPEGLYGMLVRHWTRSTESKGGGYYHPRMIFNLG